MPSGTLIASIAKISSDADFQSLYTGTTIAIIIQLTQKFAAAITPASLRRCLPTLCRRPSDANALRAPAPVPPTRVPGRQPRNNRKPMNGGAGTDLQRIPAALEVQCAPRGMVNWADEPSFLRRRPRDVWSQPNAADAIREIGVNEVRHYRWRQKFWRPIGCAGESRNSPGSFLSERLSGAGQQRSKFFAQV